MAAARIGLAAAMALVGATLLPAARVSAAPAAGARCVATKPSLIPNRGRIGGIVPHARVSAGPAACRPPDAASIAAASFNGTPPLIYGGGPLMGTSGVVTVTPLYWAGALSFPSAYQSIINGYLANVAADSGQPSNVFASVTQYTDAAARHIHYSIAAGSALLDSSAFPAAGGCTRDSGPVYTDSSGYSACVTDAQLQSEVAGFLGARGLIRDLNHLYVVFLPKGVESCFDNRNAAGGGTCSVNVFCGYHSASGSVGSPTIYASMPYAIPDGANGSTCSSDGGGVGNQSPNGNLDADTEISITSHEVLESITDPEPNSGWVDRSQNENGDDCAYIYGAGFGGTTGAKFNQTINGSRYFTQTEFSNQDYKISTANGCIQQEDAPLASFAVTTASPAAGSPVAFDGSASKELDNPSPGAVTGYAWDFGDGSAPAAGATSSHTYAAAGTYTVRLTVSDIDLFSGTSSQSVTVSVAPVAPAITSANQVTLPVLSAGSFTVAASGSPVPTVGEIGALPSGISFTAATRLLSGTPAAGTVGSYPLTFTASNGVGSAATQSFTLTVSAATSSIAWVNPADIVYGTALGATQLNATAGVAGSFSYSPPAGTILGAGGAHPLSVSFTPADPATYAVASSTVQVNVTKAPLLVTADDKTRPAGTVNPPLTFSITGFMAGDTGAAVTGAPVLETTATTSSAVGKYPITVSQGTLAAANYTFTAVPGNLTVTIDHATFTYPAAGQLNADTTQPFAWTALQGAQSYYLAVGTTLYGTDLVNSGLLPAGQTSYPVPALPTGQTLYGTILTMVAGAWHYQSITFTAAPGRGTFTVPVEGQSNVDLTQPFSWSTFPQAEGFVLVVGTTPLGSDLVNSGILPASQTSFPVPPLPPGVLYATLLTRVNGAFTRYQMVSFSANTAQAKFTYPLPGATNVETTQPFTWSTVAAAQAYYLVVGTTLYGTDLVNTGSLPNTTSTVDVGALPAGRTLYATLFTEIGGTWARFQTITFSAAPGAAAFTNPTNGQLLVDATHPFTWSTIPAGQAYLVVIGTTAYGSDLLNSGVLPAGQSSLVVPALPNGRTLYATLLTKVNGAFTRYQIITFTAR